MDYEPARGAGRESASRLSLAGRYRRGGIIMLCVVLLASCAVSTPLVTQAAQTLHPMDHLLKLRRSLHGAFGDGSSDTSGKAGCGKAPAVAPGKSADQVMISDNVDRKYRLHIPTGYDATVALPLVLAFHGDGGSGGGLEALTGLSSAADQNDFLVAYPDGLPSPGGFTAWGGVGASMPAADDVQFTSNLIDVLSFKYCVDASRIYATGFSRGGGMVALLACALADRLAAVASVSGSYFSSVERACSPSRPIAVLEFHGADDDIVPYDGGGGEDFLAVSTWLSGWASRDKCATGPATLHAPNDVIGEQWTECAGGSAVQHYRVLGLGHAWSGGAGEPKTISTSSVIWSFFQRFSLPKLAAGSEYTRAMLGLDW